MIRARLAVPGVVALLVAGCAGTTATPREIPIDPLAQVAVTVVQWENDGDTATAEVEVSNTGSPYTEFIVDTAVTDATGEQILGYGPVIVTAPAGSEPVSGTAALTGPFPADAKLGVANMWGRTPGDEQIHTVPLVGASPDSEQQSRTALLSGGQILTTAQEFAARLGAVQATCRDDPEASGLICLSRRNTAATLLPEEAQGRVQIVPYFAQRDAPDGPPRAFEIIGADGEACVGQRIDKQTSAQVAISGSCSQRGLYSGFGSVVGLVDPLTIGPMAGSAKPTWTGSATPAPSTEVRLTDVGRALPVGGADITVEGVRTDLRSVGQPPVSAPAEASFTVLSVTIAGTQPIDPQRWQLVVYDDQGVPLSQDMQAEAAVGPLPFGPEASGGIAQVVLVVQVPTGQTAATLQATDTETGQAASFRLLPPPS